jgi:cytochrome P450
MSKLRDLAGGNPIPLLRQKVDQSRGIAWLLALPKLRVLGVSDDSLIHEVLVTQASNFGKGGPIYNKMRPPFGSGIFTAADGAYHSAAQRALKPSLGVRSVYNTLADFETIVDSELNRHLFAYPLEIETFAKTITTAHLLTLLFGCTTTEETALTLRCAEPVFLGMSSSIFAPPFTRAARNYQRAVGELQLLATGHIGKYRKTGRSGGLIEQIQAIVDPATGQRITLPQVVDQVITLLMAGHDSTAVAAAWTADALARDAQMTERLRAEVLRIVGAEQPVHPHVAKLPRLTKFLEGVMQAHPSFPAFPRNVERATDLAGYELRPGDQVLIMPGKHPFGEGRRRCIGENLAIMSGLVILAKLLQRFGSWTPTLDYAGQTRRHTMTLGPVSRGMVSLR